VLHRAKEESNILHTANTRKANWTGHILHRDCFLKNKKKIIKMKVIEGKMEGREVTGRRGRSRKQLLNDHEEKKRYGNFKDEAVDRAVQRTRCGRGYGPVVRQRQEDKRRN